MIRRVLFALLAGTAHASFCGDSSIPFSFEALPDGQPVLGCARPSCFGWAPNGSPASMNGNFYRINRRPDGFMRNDRATVPPFSATDGKEMTAQCETTFQSNSCQDNQWVGGIAPLLNISAFPTVLQCCTYDALSLSTDRGVAVVNPGQIVVGGEVMRNGRQYAFDYISDLTKTINADGSVSYDVSVRRQPCLPLPENESKHGAGKNAGAFRALQAPNVEQPPISVAELEGGGNGEQQGPFQGEQNAVAEETVAEQAVQVNTGGEGPAAPSNQGASVQFFEARPVFAPAQQPVAPQFAQQPPPPQIVQQPPVQTFQQFPVQEFPVQPVQQVAAQPVQQAAAPYQPRYYGGYSGGGYYCFTADTMVESMDGTMKRMDELQKNDWIKSISNDGVSFASVNFWLHRVPSQEADFIKFTLEDGSELKLTSMHYIYKNQCTGNENTIPVDDLSDEAVFAGKVQVGECLYTVNKANQIMESKVVRREVVTEKGIYAPMTSNGRLIVNGVYASCHSVVQHHDVNRTLFSYIDAAIEYLNSMYKRDKVHTLPYGIETLVSMVEYLVPKELM